MWPVHVSLDASLAVHVSQDLDYEAMDEEHRGLLQVPRSRRDRAEIVARSE